MFYFVWLFVVEQNTLHNLLTPFHESHSIYTFLQVLQLVSTFGASKAVANIIAGPLADRFGRKPTLILGFLVGLPVMPYVNVAQGWTGVTAMNILFGISQGLLGSALFFLLIDVMGPARRGIAVGIGECTIYVATAMINIVAGDLASRYGYRPVPFMVATMFAVLGLLATAPLRDTLDQVKAEQDQQLTQIASTLRMTATEKDKVRMALDLEAAREEIYNNNTLSYRGGNNNTNKKNSNGTGSHNGGNKYLEWKKPFKESTDTISKNEASAVVSLGDQESFTSPSDVRDLHKTLVERQTAVGQSSFESTDAGSEPILKPSYEIYESLDDDVHLDDDSSNQTETYNEMLEEWDKAVLTSIQHIPSTLQVIGRIPQNVLRCAFAPNHPSESDLYDSSNNNNGSSHHLRPKSGGGDDDLLVNELTPLHLQTFESYEVYDSDTDSDDEANKEVDWDEVEEEVKTMYPSAFHLLAHILWNNPNFGILCLAGMTMNFKDGFAWGSFPLFFSKFHHLSDDHTDMLVAIYPLCWGFAQAFTGALSDVYGRSLFLLMGFGTCTIGTALFFLPGFLWGRPANDNHLHILVWVIADVCLGLGTAMAYPALQAAVADEILPKYRGLGLGFYRFTRDMGYVVGALVCGSLTDVLGYPATFLIVSGVLGASFCMIFFFYKPMDLGG